MSKPVVLILLDYYVPGYKSGGPIRTIANLVEQLGNEFDFRIVTRDRDVTETESYASIASDSWSRIGDSQVHYSSSIGFALIRRVAIDTSPDVVYLNSFFSTFSIWYLLLRRQNLVPKASVVLAPRGEFSPGALGLKHLKKRAYMLLASQAGLYRGLIWQASSIQEQAQIHSAWSQDVSVCVAPDVPPVISQKSQPASRSKNPGSVHFVFLSRITPMKNLAFALQLLGQLNGEVSLSIIGPVRDDQYWSRCQIAMAKLPSSLAVNYLGSIPHEQVQDVLEKSHFFLLPTMGENFGHAILEALVAGCPVLISDQTPWHQLLDRKVGWDLPLESEREWVRALQSCVDMNQTEYNEMSKKAREFASDWIADSGIIQANYELFRMASQKG